MAADLDRCSFRCDFDWWYQRAQPPEVTSRNWVTICDKEIHKKRIPVWWRILEVYKAAIAANGDNFEEVFHGLVYLGFVPRQAAPRLDPRVDPVPVFVRALYLTDRDLDTLDECLPAHWAGAFGEWYANRANIKPDMR